MTYMNSVNRVLVVGREVGPIVRLLRKKNPKIMIGAIDLLGNEETRKYANWKFSVEKQYPDMSILRLKKRKSIDLLYELTQIMLEDHHFDILIPTVPLNTSIEYIKKLSENIKIPIINFDSLRKTSNPYIFLNNVIEAFPGSNLIDFQYPIIPDSSSEINPCILISKSGIQYLPSDRSSKTIHNKKYFIFPLQNIHCAFIISFDKIIDFIGIQTLVAPYEHSFFFDHFEKNSLIPFFSPSPSLNEDIKLFMIELVQKLKLQGIISIFFTLVKNEILPLSSNILPDENFELWETRAMESLIPFLIMKTNEVGSVSSNFKYAFKVPIYSRESIQVPHIPQTIANQRNIVGVCSHPNYPICTILEAGNDYLKIQQQLKIKEEHVLKILSSKD